MNAQLSETITHEPKLVIQQLYDRAAQQFFNSCLPISFDNTYSILCCPIGVLENKSRYIYNFLGHYILQIIHSSSNFELRKKFGIDCINQVILHFFGNFPIQFNYDQEFLEGCYNLVQTLNVTMEIFHSRYQKYTLQYNLANPASIFLIIYETQDNFQLMFFKKVQKFQTAVPLNNFKGPQIKFQTPCNFNGQNNFNAQKQQIFNPPKIEQKQPVIQPPQNQPQAQQVNQCQIYSQNPIQKTKEEEALEMLKTEDMNKSITRRDSMSIKPKNEIINIVYRPPAAKQENKSQPDCLVCYFAYNINNNNESLLTSCCQKKPHKKCYINYLNDIASNCSDFKQLKCYLCEKSVDQKFLKEILNKATYLKIVAQLNKLQTKFTCFQCQSNVLHNQNKIICPQCNQQICPKCLMQYHGEKEMCPQLQKEILEGLQGQPIVFCPFCSYIQTKDDNCDHVTCYYCKMELCAACCCDRRPTLSHGNHFHRQGCPHYFCPKGQESKKQERSWSCTLCKENTEGCCTKPISLQEYKKEKNF